MTCRTASPRRCGPRRAWTQTKNNVRGSGRCSPNARIQEFQRASRDHSMYATASVFTGSTIPVGRVTMVGAPPLEMCFAWQWDYWVASDVLAALAATNTGGDGLRTDVERAVVKRIASIVIEPISLEPAASSSGGMPVAGPPPTITNRPDAANQDYDIRYVKLKLIVSSERLPALVRCGWPAPTT